jgi:hypothetical protein
MQESANQSNEQREKETERALLLRRIFDGLAVLAIGKELNDAYCRQFNESGYNSNYRYYDGKIAADSVSKALVDDGQLLAFGNKYKDKLSSYRDFFGKFYTYCAEKKELKPESSWPSLEQKLNNLFAKHSVETYAVLKAYIELRQDYDTWSACDYDRLAYRARELAGKGWKRALIALEIAGIVEKRGSGRRPGERSIPLELIPLVERVLSGWTTPSVNQKTKTEIERDFITKGKAMKREDSREIWDLFICHASEDKDEIARPLAEGLRAKGLRVWYDEFTLSLGDSLSSSIDQGLAGSRFGVVILSPSFFLKKWPRRELDGLTAKELSLGKVILPVWHKVDRDYVLNYSPVLADKLAVSTDQGLDKVVAEVLVVLDKDKRLKEQHETYRRTLTSKEQATEHEGGYGQKETREAGEFPRIDASLWQEIDLPSGPQQASLPRVGTLFINHGESLLKLKVVATVFLGNEEIDGVTGDIHGYYSGRTPIEMLPKWKFWGNFGIQDRCVTSPEVLRVQLDIEAVDEVGKKYRQLHFCYTYDRNKNEWFLEPTRCTDLLKR